ncbi:phage antirepressor KilAC domain-containing protein [Lactococcus formosensis]|uniref:phage antirepressor KilAC domain-containing protein n=1 Tax=Lactococcus formosensis TaxID=1281486 RepID=UPI001F05F3B3|nr:phage antirepressor KilAC domain-containing protein [Lactococcus formosensis]
MNELQNFNFSGKQIQTLLINDIPYFIGKEVAELLGYRNTRDALAKHVKEKQKKLITSQNTTLENLPNRGLVAITEGGLNRLVMHSKLKQAEDFQDWVTDEVLPSIRKHGAYMTPQTIENTLSDPDFIIRLATELKEERAARAIEAPKVLFADSVAASQNSILVRDLAKIIKQNGVDIGEKRLFSWLRENGYLVRKKGNDYNSPTQRSMDLGVLEFTENIHHHNSGMITVTKTPKVTGKGQVYFANKFLKDIA